MSSETPQAPSYVERQDKGTSVGQAKHPVSLSSDSTITFQTCGHIGAGVEDDSEVRSWYFICSNIQTEATFRQFRHILYRNHGEKVKFAR